MAHTPATSRSGREWSSQFPYITADNLRRHFLKAEGRSLQPGDILIQFGSPRRKRRRRRRSHSTKLTPPQLARQLGVSPDKIVGWIKSGELRAINIASNPKGSRPRFLIDPKDVEAFEARRSTHKTPPARCRRKRPSDDVIEFF